MSEEDGRRVDKIASHSLHHDRRPSHHLRSRTYHQVIKIDDKVRYVRSTIFHIITYKIQIP